MSNRLVTPDSRNTIPDRQDCLQRFAAFVRTSKLDEFIREEIQLFMAAELPMLKYLEQLSAEEKYEITRRSGERFLLALEEGRYDELIQDNFRRWESDHIKFIGKEQISLQDILLINSNQKIALLQFIPQFTKEPQVGVEIAARLECIYQQAQLTAINLLEKLKKEHEQRFEESEERYKDLFDNASDLIHILTAEGKILYVNNAWKQTLGYDEEEHKGESVYFFVCSKDRERFRQFRNELLEGKAAHEVIRLSFMTKDGREIIAEGNVSVKMRDGKPEYTRGIFRDVTRRVLNEEKLHYYTQQVLEREEKLQQLVKSAPDAIIVVNEEDVITVWNPKAEDIFGWEAAEVVGKDLSDTIVPPQHRDAHRRGMQRLLNTGETRVLNRTIEVTALRKDGSEFYVSLTISRASLPQGSLFISFLRDISEQKKAAMELEQQRVQLERTNSELEQYAWVTSHDLKEPLRKIRTFSDMLLTMSREDLPQEALHRIRKIQESAERMDKLIEAILMYSHSSPDETLEEVDLNTIVTEVLSDLELSISNSNAVVEVTPLPVVRGIPFQLRQLFQNLVSNAIKYNRPGVPPVITITHAIKKGYHQIEVADNGIGFKEEFAGKIFQVFQRLVARHEYEGTGIGLALCKKIAENHGGSIEAYSKEGAGSRFEILLPLHQ